MFLWCLAFDIRDRKSDVGKIVTIPTEISNMSLKILVVIVFSIALVLRLYLGGSFLKTDVIMTFLILIVNLISFGRTEKLFYLGLVDGLPILWMVLICV
jgi:hypothetical protein